MAKARRSEFEQRRFQKLLGQLKEENLRARAGEPCPTCGSIVQPQPKPIPTRRRSRRRPDRNYWRDDRGRLISRPPKRKPERPVELVAMGTGSESVGARGGGGPPKRPHQLPQAERSQAEGTHGPDEHSTT